MTMDEKLDSVVSRVEERISAWLDEFERAPFQMAIKVVIALWLFKLAKRHLWHS